MPLILHAMRISDCIVLFLVGAQVVGAGALAVIAFGWWGVALDVTIIAAFVAAVLLGIRYRRKERERRGW